MYEIYQLAKEFHAADETAMSKSLDAVYQAFMARRCKGASCQVAIHHYFSSKSTIFGL